MCNVSLYGTALIKVRDTVLEHTAVYSKYTALYSSAAHCAQSTVHCTQAQRTVLKHSALYAHCTCVPKYAR